VYPFSPLSNLLGEPGSRVKLAMISGILADRDFNAKTALS